MPGRLLVQAVVLCTLALLPAAPVLAKDGGNSPNAKACYKGGWNKLANRDGVLFASQEACTDYGAGGGNYTRVFVLAYSNLDGHTGFNPVVDVLISYLVDTNGNNLIGSGDTVHMGKYPLNTAATAFSSFNVPTHAV